MTQYHEPVSELQPIDRDIVRALISLKEEIEAVDWYHQRAATAADPELKAVLLHNRNEEIEHACMALEWLRRNMPEWDQELRTYLFQSAPITEIEEEGEGGAGGEDVSVGSAGLGIGSLKK